LSSSRSERYFAPCPRGLEALLAEELSGFGARNPASVPGGVAFEGDPACCYTANLRSRLASRVLWRIAEFGYRSQERLTRGRRSFLRPKDSTEHACRNLDLVSND